MDGGKYDGKDLLRLVKEDKSPFRNDWDVKLLVEEVESKLDAKIHNIYAVSKGSSNYVSVLLNRKGRLTHL